MTSWTLHLPDGSRVEVVPMLEATPVDVDVDSVDRCTQLERERDAAWEAYRDLAERVTGPTGVAHVSTLDPDREWMLKHWRTAIELWKKAKAELGSQP